MSEGAGFVLNFSDVEHSGLFSSPESTRVGSHRQRLRRELLPVLREESSHLGAPEAVAYDMYRDVRRVEDESLLERVRCRYDVTVLHPNPLGGESAKTLGHYHPPLLSEPMLSYPEVYQVLRGQALYLLQKRGQDPRDIEEVVLVEASPGHIVAVPPGFGHVTINPGPAPLVMANWVASDFKSLYGNFVTLRGACYYRLVGADTLVSNPRYRNVPQVKAVPGGLATARFMERIRDAALLSEGDTPSVYMLFTREPSLFGTLHAASHLAGLYD